MRRAGSIAALCFVASRGVSGFKVESDARPSLVFILVDDLGFNDCWLPRCDLHGAWKHVGALARDGVALETYYTTWLCTPTRGAFMTGRYPTRLGLHHGVISGFRDYGLPKNETTLADKLRSAGYSTHHVGKWHLGSYDNASTPLRRGFDTTYGFSNGEEDHWTHIVNGLYDLHNGTDYAIGPTVTGTHGTYLFAAAAADVVATASRPYFLYYALQNTHMPLEAPESYIDSEPCASIESDANYAQSMRLVFCAMAAMADEAIHNVTTQIDPSTSLVVIAGDNGGLIAGGGSNWPLRGQKAEPWEGGVRNHALLWGWGLDEWRQRSHIGPATYNMGLVHVTDVHASFVALAGASNPYEIDGLDVFPAIQRNQPSPRQELLAMYDPCSSTSLDGACSNYTFAYIYHGFKLVWPGPLNDTWYAPLGVADDDLDSTFTTLLWPAPYGDVRLDALASARRDDSLHLYNLHCDPQERLDLVTANASHEVRRLIRTIYSRFELALGNEMPPCNIPNGSCYDDDPVGETTCGLGGFWRPWVTD